jgi:hypothetical protein
MSVLTPTLAPEFGEALSLRVEEVELRRARVSSASGWHRWPFSATITLT